MSSELKSFLAISHARAEARRASASAIAVAEHCDMRVRVMYEALDLAREAMQSILVTVDNPKPSRHAAALEWKRNDEVAKARIQDAIAAATKALNGAI